jgi:hypothetical protein
VATEAANGLSNLGGSPGEVGKLLDFGKYEVVSFDCYGTLIDWEGGPLPDTPPVPPPRTRG